MMRSLLSIFLSVYMMIGSLIPGNNFFELSGTPALLKHFQYHRQIETPGINFPDFLALHYSNPTHDKSDPANHCKLPMHHGVTAPPVDEIVYIGDNDALYNFSNKRVTSLFVVSVLFLPTENPNDIFRPPNT